MASDHASFAHAGIPIGGVFTGAGGRKTTAQQARFGGRAGAPYDACSHRACDTLANVDTALTASRARAAASVIAGFTQDVSLVRRAG